MARFEDCGKCVDPTRFEGMQNRSGLFSDMVSGVLDIGQSGRRTIEAAMNVELPDDLSDELREEFLASRESTISAVQEVEDSGGDFVSYVMQCQVIMNETAERANATDCSLAADLGICPRVTIVDAALDEMARSLGD